MSAWLVVLAVGLGSYLFRISIVVLVDRIGAPARFERASAFVVPAAFAALAAGAIIATTTGGGAAQAVPPLVAVGVAVAAVHRTGSPYMAIAVGMPILWVLGAVLPS